MANPKRRYRRLLVAMTAAFAWGIVIGTLIALETFSSTLISLIGLVGMIALTQIAKEPGEPE